MANQFTKGTRTEHDEATKDRIRAELLSKKYYKFAMASPKRQVKMGISKEQVAAAKMLIDKGKPSLQSIESKDIDPFDDMSVEMMVEQCRALILSHPEIIQALNLVPAPALVTTETDTSTATGTDGPLQP
jgi:hypothetical protein